MRALVLLIAASVLTSPAPGEATEVYWVPAHDLAPQGYGECVTAGDLDGDLDCDLSMLTATPPWQFWNIGTPQSPDWELDRTQFGEIPPCVHRVGALGDVDDDGDLDLVVACYYEQSLRFYWNVGTPSEPQWEYDPTPFEGITVPGGGVQQHFADLEADGDLDLLVTQTAGGVKYIQNVGTPTDPEWQEAGFLDGVNAGDWARAALGDMDGDGDLDMVGVDLYAPPRAWENVGTPEIHEFVENPSMLMGVDAPARGFGIELFDVDGDGDPDLLIGGIDGQNFLYLNETITAVEPSSWGRIKALFR